MRKIITVIIALLFVIVSGIFTSLDLHHNVNAGDHDTTSEEISEVTYHSNRSISTPISTNGTKPKEEIPPLDTFNKTAVQERMLNSIHYYDSAKGSFTYSSKQVGFHYKIDYKLHFNQNNFTYHFKIVDPIQNVDGEEIYGNNELVQLNNKAKTYKKMNVLLKTKGKKQAVANVYKKNSNGEKIYMYPETDVQLGLPGLSLYSTDLAIGYLENHDLWSIKGTETLLDRDAVVIEGQFDDSYRQKLGAETFTIWMDYTGIILAFETYDSEKNVVDSLVTENIKINEKVGSIEAEKMIPKDFKEARGRS